MGEALVRRLLAADYSLTVHNRTPGKAATLTEFGAQHEAGIVQAIKASELIIVCVTDEAASREVLLASSEAADALAGRTVVVLSTMASEAGFPMALFVREATSGQLDFDYYAEQILSGDFAADEATIDLEAAAYAGVPGIMQQLGLNTGLAKATNAIFEQAQALGDGQDELAALSEVFRLKV